MIDGMRAWHVFSWYIYPPDLSSVPFLHALGSVGWHRASQTPLELHVVAGAKGSAPSGRCKAHPHGTGLGAFAGFCRVFGVLLGGGEMGLFQGGVVRAGFMKRAVCFYPDSQRRCLQSREENLCPWSTQGTSTARGFFSCWLTLTFYCTWPFC